MTRTPRVPSPARVKAGAVVVGSLRLFGVSIIDASIARMAAAEAAARIEREVYVEVLDRLAEAQVAFIAEEMNLPPEYVAAVLGGPSVG